MDSSSLKNSEIEEFESSNVCSTPSVTSPVTSASKLSISSSAASVESDCVSFKNSSIESSTSVNSSLFCAAKLDST